MSKGRMIGISVAVITATLNWLFFRWLGGALGLSDPTFFASVTMVSIVVHELGHLVALERKGITTHIFFAIIMGGAVPWDKKKFDTLHWRDSAKVSLAGCVGNIVVALCAIALHMAGYLSRPQTDVVLNLNGILIVWNLLPFWITDGGRFTKVLFDSIPEHEDKSYAVGLTVSIAMVALALTILTPEMFIMEMWLFFWAFHFQAKKDDPHGSQSHLAMSRRECGIWSGVYAAMVMTGFILVAVTPHWIDILK